MKNLELKYDKLVQNVYQKRHTKIQECKSYPDFWLRVLSNHRIIKDFISEEDKDILKHLIDIRYIKLEDGLVHKFLKNFFL